MDVAEANIQTAQIGPGQEVSGSPQIDTIRNLFRDALLDHDDLFSGTNVKMKKHKGVDQTGIPETIVECKFKKEQSGNKEGENDRKFAKGDSFFFRFQDNALAEISFGNDAQSNEYYSVVFNPDGKTVQFGRRKKWGKKDGGPSFRAMDQASYEQNFIDKITSFADVMDERIQFIAARRKFLLHYVVPFGGGVLAFGGLGALTQLFSSPYHSEVSPTPTEKSNLSGGGGYDPWREESVSQTPTPAVEHDPIRLFTENPDGTINFSETVDLLENNVGEFIIPTMLIVHWDGNESLDKSQWLSTTTRNGLSDDTVTDSATFAVGVDGIRQLVKMTKTQVQSTTASRGREGCAINIEMSGAWFDDNPPLQNETDYAVDLIARLRLTYNLTAEQIRGHYQEDTSIEVSPDTFVAVPTDYPDAYHSGKSDPGKIYLRHLKEKVEERLQELRSQHNTDRFLETNRQLGRLEADTIGESAFFAQSAHAESVSVNADTPFETWSLNKLPLALLILKDSGGIKNMPQITRDELVNLMYGHNDTSFRNFVYIAGGSSNWESACQKVVERFSGELGMGNTIFNIESGLFKTTARDLGSMVNRLGKMSSEDRDFIIQTLSSQVDTSSRIEYFMKNSPNAAGYKPFHIIGNGVSEEAGVSWHDMGGLIGPGGEVITFVTLNQHQTESLEPVNTFESQALEMALLAFGGKPTEIYTPRPSEESLLKHKAPNIIDGTEPECKSNVFLTIDDFNDPQESRKMLQFLKDGNLKATVFPNTYRIFPDDEELRNLLRDLYKQGNIEIGYHTTQHQVFTDPVELENDVKEFELFFQDLLGDQNFRVKLARPPYGDALKEWSDFFRNRASIVWWNFDINGNQNVKDFEAYSQAPAGGGILLLHTKSEHAEWLANNTKELERIASDKSGGIKLFQDVFELIEP